MKNVPNKKKTSMKHTDALVTEIATRKQKVSYRRPNNKSQSYRRAA